MLNMKKILRYAIIGARHEVECYFQLASMERGLDKDKEKMYTRLAKSAHADAREISTALASKAELWQDIEVR